MTCPQSQIGNRRSPIPALRVGIVGLGWWACDVHVPNLLRTPNAQIAALCSRSEAGRQRGLEALGEHPEPLLFERFDDLLASDAVDAVVLCTPNATHGALALQAVRAGKHVLVEKPLATDPAECPPIVAAAAERGVVVQVGVELRHAPVVRAMRQQIEAGAIGQPVVLRTELWRQWNAPHGWRADPAHGSDTLYELAVHYLDLLGVLAAARPAWVTAGGGARVTGHQPDHAMLTVGYADGAVGVLGLCLFARGSTDAIPLEAVGTEGRLLGDVLGGTLRLWTKDGEARDLSPARSDAEVCGFPGSLECVGEFVAAIREGRAAHADAREGEILCRLCDGARRSLASQGRRIEL